jgi:predicted nucleic acid-binding protein
MLDYENSKNPYSQKATAINEWKEKALVDVDESPPIIEIAKEIRSTGIKTADSLHIACAIYANCNYFVSTDKRILKYKSRGIVVCDPIECLRLLEDAGDDE